VELGLYARVLWRYRPLLVYGFFVAVVLAFLSYARITTHGVQPRGGQTWQSTVTLLISRQHDFPWGRTAPEYLPAKPGGIPSVQVADQNELTNLALIYAELANSDAVRKLIQAHGAVHGTLQAQPVFETANSSVVNGSQYPLPLLRLTSTASSSAWAVSTARIGTSAFLQYLRNQQNAAKIPGDQRVSVEVLQRADAASPTSGHGKALPLIVFMGVLIAVVALAFVLENLRPRPQVQSLRSEQMAEAVQGGDPIRASADRR
jgi:hypothetical protein